MKRENSGKSGTSDCLRSLSMLKVGVDDIMPCDQIIEAKILPLLDGWIPSTYFWALHTSSLHAIYKPQGCLIGKHKKQINKQTSMRLPLMFSYPQLCLGEEIRI